MPFWEKVFKSKIKEILRVDVNKYVSHTGKDCSEVLVFTNSKTCFEYWEKVPWRLFLLLQRVFFFFFKYKTSFHTGKECFEV